MIPPSKEKKSPSLAYFVIAFLLSMAFWRTVLLIVASSTSASNLSSSPGTLGAAFASSFREEASVFFVSGIWYYSSINRSFLRGKKKGSLAASLFWLEPERTTAFAISG